MSSALFGLQVIDQGPQSLTYVADKQMTAVGVCSVFLPLLGTHHSSLLSDYFNELNILGRMDDI